MQKNNLPRSGVQSFADSGEMNDIHYLIRSDFYWGLVIVWKEWKQEGLVIDRKFWYILSSPIVNNTVERCATNLVHSLRISCTANESKALDSQLKQFCELESIETVARCLETVQLKHNFFLERISLRSWVSLSNSHSLDL